MDDGDDDETGHMNGDASDEDMEDEDDEYGDEEYSDDEDDASWKIRRAAVKTVAAVARSSPAALESDFDSTVERLLTRLRREREESVKLDLFAALEDILRTCSRAGVGSGLDDAVRTAVPAVAKASISRLVDKRAGAKVKTAALELAREIAARVPASLESSLGFVVPALAKVLAGGVPQGGSALRVEALALSRLIFESHDAASTAPHVDALAPQIFAAADDKYYKVAAEALRACRALVPVVASAVPAHAAALSNAALSRVGATDQDQEVKDAAIACAGSTAAMLGDAMGADLPRCLKLLLDRLKNEITRLAAVKAIGAVATSELNPPMGESAAAATVELAGFLRKTNRPLRQASLFALDALVSKHAGSLSDAEVTAAVEEASALVSDGDLALASAALSLSASAVSSKGRAPFANACSAVCEKTLPAALELVRSPLMQSHALHALTSFFTALVSAKLSVAGASSDDLLARLMGSG